jgi:uroporphyrin-3 C-methyltransferase
MMSELVPEEKKESKIMRPRSWWWLNILLIVLILFLVGTGMGFYITKTQQLSQTIESLSAQAIKTQELHAIEVSQLQALQQQVNHQAIQLFQQQQSLQQLSLFEQQKQWKFAEIVYLIQLANTSLHFGHDIKASQQLLLQAHTIIVELHDPSLDNLDQALQIDVHVLAEVQQQDVAQIFVQISDLEQQVDNMPLLGSGFASEENMLPDEVVPMTGSWRQRLRESLHQLKYLVIVRKTPNPLLPLIAQEQGEYINQFLHMQLGQAQWAVLHHDKAIYQSSLEQCSVWVNRYYVILNPQTQDVLSALTALQNQEVSFPEVTLDKTLHALSIISPA